jgi:hypothetical protein
VGRNIVGGVEFVLGREEAEGSRQKASAAATLFLNAMSGSSAARVCKREGQQTAKATA